MEKRRSVGFEIKTLSHMIMRKFHDFVIPVQSPDITTTQGWIIGYIYGRLDEGDVYQRDIEQEFHIRRSTATGMLQLLEKNGYIIRKPVERDARLKSLVLTEKGIAEQERIEAMVDKFDAMLESELTHEEIVTFLAIAEKIKKTIE